MAHSVARSDLLAEAITVLAANDTGHFIKPGPRQYPGQWNWDAAFNVIGLAHVDPARARQEVRSLLEGQWDDGMVPHIVFHDAEVDYFPGPSVWGRTPGMPSVPTSGITQPPLLATAVAHLHRLAPDRAFLEEVLGPIERWHRWFHAHRVERGLVRILHPWESGMDNSPRFDSALHKVERQSLDFVRRDRNHVPTEQRPSDEEYGAYLAILTRLRETGYRPERKEAIFDMGDVFLTAVLSKAESDLAVLWTELGGSPAAGIGRRDTLRRGLHSAWDDRRGLFLDDGGSGTVTIGGLLPAYATPGHRAHGRLEALLRDPDFFGPTAWGERYATSVARHSPVFDPRCYWRGPIWINVNWLIVHILEESNHHEMASHLRATTLELVAEQGFWEYYDPNTGQGLGSPDFSWTAALTIDLLSRGRP